MEPLPGVFDMLQYFETINLWSMFHSVCCLFHAKRCRLSHREESSVSLTIFVSLTQALFRYSSLNGWTEYADVITKFSGIDRFEKEINYKNSGRRSYKLSSLLRSAGIASQNIVMKEQYTLLWSALLWTPFFWIDRFQFSYMCGAPLRTLRWRGRSAEKKKIREV